MTDTLELDLHDPETVGFRLHRLGSTTGAPSTTAWSLELDGANGLVTGDIGSGKSTLSTRSPSVGPAGEDLLQQGSRRRTSGTHGCLYVLGHYKSGTRTVAEVPNRSPCGEQPTTACSSRTSPIPHSEERLPWCAGVLVPDRSGTPARMYAVGRSAGCRSPRTSAMSATTWRTQRRRLRNEGSHCTTATASTLRTSAAGWG